MPELHAARTAADRPPTGSNSPPWEMQAAVDPRPAAGATGQLQLHPCNGTFEEEGAFEGASFTDVPYQQVTNCRSLERCSTQVAVEGAST